MDLHTAFPPSQSIPTPIQLLNGSNGPTWEGHLTSAMDLHTAELHPQSIHAESDTNPIHVGL